MNLAKFYLLSATRSGLARSSLLILASLLLCSCSLLSPAKIDVPCKYRLLCVPKAVPTRPTRPITILVTTPIARPVFDTTKMAYSIKPYQIAYFSRNEWAETPGQMLRPLIVQTLERTRYFKAVVSPPYGGHVDYILNTEILELNQDFTHCPPCLIMVVRAQILKTAINKIIATRQFTMTLPIPYGTPYGGVFAANHATSVILCEIALFCLEEIY